MFSSSIRASTTSTNGGAEEYFISPADAMNRNLESRVEVLVPIEDAGGRQRLRTTLDMQLAPNRNAWNMLYVGSYLRADVDPHDRGAQMELMDWPVVEPMPVTHRRKRRLPACYARRPSVTAAL